MEGHSTFDLLVGYTSLIISCFCFGFMFAPLKKFDSKDGVFVQWVQCSVVFMFGLVINVVRGLPPFNLIACIGGFLYATGNIASVQIVNEMGIGLGMLIWGTIQIIVGWCVARFGLFGTKAQTIGNLTLNYVGVALTLLSGLMFVFVYGQENTEKFKDENPYGASNEFESYGSVWATELGVTSRGTEVNSSLNNARSDQIHQRLQRKVLPMFSKRKLFFICLAVCLGTLHGLMMTPIVYIQDNDPNHSNNVLDYVFSHFSAVFFFSTIYFILYSILKRGHPHLAPELVLPSVVYGILWSVAMTLFIVSNRLLSQTVSFPITVRLPAIIGSIADVLLFRAISGKQSLIYLTLAILVGSIGVILVGISL